MKKEKTMNGQQKKFLILGIVFSVLAIAFALFYYFDVIRFLDNYLALVYVIYFVGLALMFAGSYVQNNPLARLILIIISILLIVASTIMLIVGFATGYIDISFKV